jgi:hypothetical protein
MNVFRQMINARGNPQAQRRVARNARRRSSIGGRGG